MEFVKMMGAVIVLMIIGYLAVGAVSTIPEPDEGTDAKEQYDSLIDLSSITFTGYQGIIYLGLAGVLLLSLVWLAKTFG